MKLEQGNAVEFQKLGGFWTPHLRNADLTWIWDAGFGEGRKLVLNKLGNLVKHVARVPLTRQADDKTCELVPVELFATQLFCLSNGKGLTPQQVLSPIFLSNFRQKLSVHSVKVQSWVFRTFTLQKRPDPPKSRKVFFNKLCHFLISVGCVNAVSAKGSLPLFLRVYLHVAEHVRNIFSGSFLREPRFLAYAVLQQRSVPSFRYKLAHKCLDEVLREPGPYKPNPKPHFQVAPDRCKIGQAKVCKVDVVHGKKLGQISGQVVMIVLSESGLINVTFLWREVCRHGRLASSTHKSLSNQLCEQVRRVFIVFNAKFNSVHHRVVVPVSEVRCERWRA